MNNVKIKEDIDSLTYAMSDEEISELHTKLLTSTMNKNNTVTFTAISEDELNEITDFIDTLPYPRKLINSLVKIGEYTREELEAENRRLYAEKGWEKYL